MRVKLHCIWTAMSVVLSSYPMDRYRQTGSCIWLVSLHFRQSVHARKAAAYYDLLLVVHCIAGNGCKLYCQPSNGFPSVVTGVLSTEAKVDAGLASKATNGSITTFSRAMTLRRLHWRNSVLAELLYLLNVGKVRPSLRIEMVLTLGLLESISAATTSCFLYRQSNHLMACPTQTMRKSPVDLPTECNGCIRPCLGFRLTSGTKVMYTHGGR